MYIVFDPAFLCLGMHSGGKLSCVQRLIYVYSSWTQPITDDGWIKCGRTTPGGIWQSSGRVCWGCYTWRTWNMTVPKSDTLYDPNRQTDGDRKEIHHWLPESGGRQMAILVQATMWSGKCSKCPTVRLWWWLYNSKHTKHSWIVYVKWVICMSHKLYFNKTLKEIIYHSVV